MLGACGCVVVGAGGVPDGVCGGVVLGTEGGVPDGVCAGGVGTGGFAGGETTGGGCGVVGLGGLLGVVGGLSDVGHAGNVVCGTVTVLPSGPWNTVPPGTNPMLSLPF